MYEMDPPSLDSSGSAEDVDDDDRDRMKNRRVVRNTKNFVNLVSEIAGFFV